MGVLFHVTYFSHYCPQNKLSYKKKEYLHVDILTLLPVSRPCLGEILLSSCRLLKNIVLLFLPNYEY